jgi:hypothetical protein
LNIARAWRERADEAEKKIKRQRHCRMRRVGTEAALASCRSGEATDPSPFYAILMTFKPLLRRGLFFYLLPDAPLLQIPYAANHVAAQRNERASRALLFRVSNLAQTILESWRTLRKWAQLKYAKKGQKKLTREQSSPSTRASRRLGSGLLPNGRSSPKRAITPSTV